MAERTAGHRLGLALTVAGVVAVLVGGFATYDASRGASPVGEPAVSASASPELGTTALPSLAPVRPGDPLRVRIPALGVVARVLPVHAPAGTLVPPSDPAELGWWADGARPGSGRGAVLIAGHTVHNGAGALNALGAIPPGALIVLRTNDGEVLRYQVHRVETFAKGTIAAKAARLFAQTGPERLVLVTCADWNGTRYLSNAVVIAVPWGR